MLAWQTLPPIGRAPVSLSGSEVRVRCLLPSSAGRLDATRVFSARGGATSPAHGSRVAASVGGAALLAVSCVRQRWRAQHRGHCHRGSRGIAGGAEPQKQPTVEILGVPLTPDYVSVGIVYFAQGALGLVALAKPYLLKDELHLSPAEATQLLTLTYWPWLLKPLWGFVADAFPIFGSRRRAYLLLAGFTSILGYLGIGTSLVGDAKEATLVLLMLGNLGIAVSDVIVDAIVVEKARKDDRLMENLQSYSWCCRAVGAILSAYSSGALLEAWGIRPMFSATSVLPLLVVLAAVLISEDEPQPEISGPTSVIDNGVQQAQKLWDTVRSPEIYLPLLFIVCWQATPNSGSAMFYFFTNELQFKPEFIGLSQLIGAISSLAGTVLYNRVFAAMPARDYLLKVNLIAVALGLLPLLLVTRANVGLGIPDQAFVLGDDVVQTVAGELAHMPILVLAARLCPPGVEATVFALLMSALNLAGFVSGLIGSALTDYLHVTESDFGNLPLLILVCNLSGLLPLALLTFVPDPTEREKKATINP